MSYLKSSNLLLACLLSTKASLFLIAPVQGALSAYSQDNTANSRIEIEVVNLATNDSDSSDYLMLVADAGYDRGQDYDRGRQGRQARQA
ncbi:hypothetical protein QUB40_12835 [Microcoleus sp. AT9_A2]|uniref:hypothetical protein n=1 Tax=Microcoleus sp. AT9_A2 TaxID=2818624 RepID=UPI002FD6C570